jgi:hypothetical protein
MEDILPQLSWNQFVVLVIILLLLHLLIHFFEGRIRRMALSSTFQLLNPITNFVSILYESVAFIILIGTFILINPVLHGSLFLLLFILGYKNLRDYLNGRIILLDKGWKVGNQLQAKGLSGTITKLGRLGIYLQDVQGQHFVSYTRLLAEGYTLAADQQSSSLYQLMIKPAAEGDLRQHKQRIMDLMAKTPYLDWSHLPVVSLQEEGEPYLEASLFLKEDKQLPDFMLLAKEWGYHCKKMQR